MLVTKEVFRHQKRELMWLTPKRYTHTHTLYTLSETSGISDPVSPSIFSH